VKKETLCSFSDYLSRRVRKIANSDYWLRNIGPYFRLYACNDSAPIGRIFMKFYVWIFFWNLPSKIQFH